MLPRGIARQGCAGLCDDRYAVACAPSALRPLFRHVPCASSALRPLFRHVPCAPSALRDLDSAGLGGGRPTPRLLIQRAMSAFVLCCPCSLGRAFRFLCARPRVTRSIATPAALSPAARGPTPRSARRPVNELVAVTDHRRTPVPINTLATPHGVLRGMWGGSRSARPARGRGSATERRAARTIAGRHAARDVGKASPKAAQPGRTSVRRRTPAATGSGVELPRSPFRTQEAPCEAPPRGWSGLRRPVAVRNGICAGAQPRTTEGIPWTSVIRGRSCSGRNGFR
jgi:hypothetical protein